MFFAISGKYFIYLKFRFSLYFYLLNLSTLDIYEKVGVVVVTVKKQEGEGFKAKDEGERRIKWII